MKHQMQFLMELSGSVLSTSDEREAFRELNVARRENSRIKKELNLLRTKGKRDPSLSAKLGQTTRKIRLVRHKIVLANLGLITFVLKRTRVRNVDHDELMSEGTLVLVRAVDKFKVSRGRKFSTYAVRALVNGFSRLGLIQSKKHDPCIIDHELAEGSRELVHYDDHGVSERHEVRELINAHLSQLSDNESFVIRRQFGLHDGRCWNLAQVGELLDVSKERVRQIRERGLAKLREAWDTSGDNDEGTETDEEDLDSHNPGLPGAVLEVSHETRSSHLRRSKVKEEEYDRVLDLLEDIDRLGENLTDWEIRYVSKLIQNPPIEFTPAQVDKIEQIYEERVP